VHKKYIQSGGQFIETTEATRKVAMAKKKQDKDKSKHLEYKKDVKKDKKK
jgi:hypothetical protein